MKTCHAPTERIDRQQLIDQIKSVGSNPAIDALLNAAFDLLLVINAQRQIVALNGAFATALGLATPEKAFGLRFGEALHCKYAYEQPHGCGTTPYCSSCGAVIAMMAAIDDNQVSERTCALKTDHHGQANDTCLLIRSRPIIVDDRRFFLVYARDISKEQYAFNVEANFLKNMSAMLNTAKSYGLFVQYVLPDNELLQQLNQMTDRAIQEIDTQSMLSHHSDSHPIASFEKVGLFTIRTLVFSIVLNRDMKIGKLIEENELDKDTVISTDPVLAVRVIVNMLQNALDATSSGNSVRLHTVIAADQVTWHVWNQAHIPENIQPRIFQRYFTTKAGHGCGQGTYLMKLFGERCLGGKVSFTSTLEEGTTFSFTLPIQYQLHERATNICKGTA